MNLPMLKARWLKILGSCIKTLCDYTCSQATLLYTAIPSFKLCSCSVGKNVFIKYKTSYVLFKINTLIVCFLQIVESHPKFSINFLISLNLIILLNWVRAYLHIRYLTSLPVFLHCFMILSKQSLAGTSITTDTPPRVIFINQR